MTSIFSHCINMFLIFILTVQKTFFQVHFSILLMLIRTVSDTDTSYIFLHEISYDFHCFHNTCMQCFTAHQCSYLHALGKAVTDKIKLSKATRHVHVFDPIPYITLTIIYTSSIASSINLLNLFAHTQVSL